VIIISFALFPDLRESKSGAAAASASDGAEIGADHKLAFVAPGAATPDSAGVAPILAPHRPPTATGGRRP